MLGPRGAQLLQLAPPVLPWYCPALQLAQAAAPDALAAAKVPAAQLAQVGALAAEKVPAAQTEQLVEPVAELDLPAGQGVQRDVPAADA